MLYELPNIRSRAATAENPRAEKGRGGIEGNGRKGSPCIAPFSAGETKILLDTDGPGMVRHIWMTVPPGNPHILRNIILRMYWDNNPVPSVEVPIGDFFGVAYGQQKPLHSDLISMQDAKGFNCFIPMPFRTHARITVQNDADVEVSLLFYQIDFTLDDHLGTDIGYFHSQFRCQSPCPMHEDYTILDGVAGRGRYLGMVLGVRSHYQGAWWGEGEVKFFLDNDKEFPTICGTGAEDYMGSAWGMGEVSTPWQGCPLCNDEQGIYSIYRFHVPDPICFQENLRVTIQQIGYGDRQKAREHYGADFVEYHAAGAAADAPDCYFDRSDDYCSVAYWYQDRPAKEFPALPNRQERSCGLECYQTASVRRNDV